jgi:hypothetical protein
MKARRGLVVLLLTIVGLMAASASAEAAFTDYGLESVSASTTTSQAGAHPDVTLDFKLTTDKTSEKSHGVFSANAATKNFTVNMPPGLLGNLNAVEECPLAQFLHLFAGEGGSCPFSSQIGIHRTKAYPFGAMNGPIYLLEPPKDGVARLGLYVFVVPIYITIRVRSNSDYGLTASIEGASSGAGLVESEVTLWGVPGSEMHNTERLTVEEKEKKASPPRPFGKTAEPFLTNPTSCEGPLTVGFAAESYQVPGQVSAMQATLPAITGCEELGFEPSFSVTPTSHVAETPTGLEAALSIPQNESVTGRSTAQLRDASVQLPPGMTIASGAGDGLEACSAEQAGYQSTHVAECPLASQIGTATFAVPALREEEPGVTKVLHGHIYQRTPEPGNQFRIWLVADEDGVHVAIPGDIHANPVTGQLTNVFVDTPQVPVKELTLHIKSGSRAPLATPRACGTYTTHFEFTPWSRSAPAVGDSPMTINEGCGTGGFAPKLSAGSTVPNAGAFAGFALNVTRESGEQNITGMNIELPRGLLAKLSGIQLCGDAEASTGACPAGSQIGTATVAAGPGPTPLWVPQPGKEPTAVYLGGPYKGAPYSVIVKVPAQAGPFNLGTVAVRAAIAIDPETAQVTVESDPLPQILEGVPITYRTIHVDLNRPNFVLNPTNCESAAVTAQFSGSSGGAATGSDRFVVGNCEALGFKPKLQLSLRGSTKHAGHPGLKAVLTYPKSGAWANIARAQVNLPHSEFIDQANLNKTCTKPVLLAGQCPAKSIYGKVKAWTPLLDKPLEGPVYLVGGYGYKLPALVAELNGQIRVLLVGKVDSGPNHGIRNTFEAVPDAPVEKFELELKGGPKYSLLENSEDLCAKAQRGIARFTGQNGRIEQMKPLIANGCKKKGRSGSQKHQASAKSKPHKN